MLTGDMIASAPDGPVRVPPAVHRLAGGTPPEAVWRNELGGLTFRLGDGPDRRFVKWQPPEVPIDLAGEAARLRWARPWTPVPEVLDVGADEQGRWLLTRGLPGDSAVAPRWLADPATAVRALGAGLHALHTNLPVARCPYRWSPGGGRPAPPVPAPDLVVCHGDACAPNTLLDAAGDWSGHVDLGALGVGDRWADLAIATWSTRWNYGPGWERPLLAAYGIDPDRERIARYRQLWGSAPPS